MAAGRAESSHLDPQAGGRETHWEWCESFEPSKPSSIDTPPYKATPSNLFLKVPPIGDQVFKRMSLWASLSFRLPQRATELHLGHFLSGFQLQSNLPDALINVEL